ncbi:MAG: OsmC family protein [Acidobacteria bacterium]|nr:OsmC family protein [Acidobacteriota bacterium]
MSPTRAASRRKSKIKTMKEGLVVRAQMEQYPYVDIRTRHAQFGADQPEEFSGSNRGPMPVELLLGAYLASVAMLSWVAAKEMDCELGQIKLQARAQIDPRGLYGLRRIKRMVRSVSLEVGIVTDSGNATLPARLSRVVHRRCPIRALLQESGVKLIDRWEILPSHL